MKDRVVFIDDQENIRKIYGRRLARLFQDLAEVVVLEPQPTTERMLAELFTIENIVSYIIDENLTFSGGTNYQGVGLIKEIRDVDPKIPIYILTSNVTLVDPLSGDIEFVIDKVDLNKPENKDKFLKRFIRHLGTYKDIKSFQAERFETLLLKSLEHPLTNEEKDEFDILNVLRSKILMDESCITQNDLDILEEQSNKLDQIEKMIRDISDEK